VSGQPAPLRIVIADDQASVREGLVLLLGLLPDIEVVASAADGRQAIDLVAQHQPDAILLDLYMPVMDGIETTRKLTELHPAVAIVVLTTYADDTSILTAMLAGARSYLTKGADRVEIASALRSAASGLSVLGPTVRQPSWPPPRVTPRHAEPLPSSPKCCPTGSPEERRKSWQ